MPNQRSDGAFLSLFAAAPALLGLPQKPVWPLTLRDGLPTALPGWIPAPKDDLPEEDENEMGKYVEVSRFFQRIESPTSAKQFRLVIQDYGDRSVVDSIRRAVAEAKKNPAVEVRGLEIGGRKTFAVTDHSSARPATIVTVIVSPSRLVVGQGAIVEGEEAIGLVKRVDLARVAAVGKEPGR